MMTLLINPDGLKGGSEIGGQLPAASVAMAVGVRVGVTTSAVVSVASARRAVAAGCDVGTGNAVVAAIVVGGVVKMTARANFVGASSVGSGVGMFAVSEHANT